MKTKSQCKALAAALAALVVGITGFHAAQAQSLAAGAGLSVRSSPPLGYSGSTGTFSGLSFNVTDQLSIESYFRGPTAQIAGLTARNAAVLPAFAVGQTLMGQYRFGEERQDFRPRLGAGLAYSLGRQDRDMGLANALHDDAASFSTGTGNRDVTGLGLALEAGASYAISKSWYLKGSVMRSYIRSTGSSLSALPGGAVPGLKIDPLTVNFSVGFKFQ